jgi:hypothetical protein
MKRLLTIFLILAHAAAAQTITFDSNQTISDPLPAVDFTATAKWDIHFGTDSWKKAGRTLYPDADDITSEIQAKMDNVEAQISVFIKEAVQAGKYSITPTGLSLSNIATLNWYYVCVENDAVCRIRFRQNNREYQLTGFPDPADETAAASAALANANTDLAAIAQDVEDNGFHN